MNIILPPVDDRNLRPIRKDELAPELFAGVNKTSPNVKKKIIQKLNPRFHEVMDLDCPQTGHTGG
jgi:hypothetical protein